MPGNSTGEKIMEQISHLNYLAVLVGGVIFMIIGAIWYSPMCCGNLWMKCNAGKNNGKDKVNEKEKECKCPPTTYLYGFLVSLVISLVLAIFVYKTNVNTLHEGACIGLWAWLGFTATTSLNGVIWGGKSFTHWLIDAGYYLVSYPIVAAILAIWR